MARKAVLLFSVAQQHSRTGRTKHLVAACFGHRFYVFLDNRICVIKNKHLTLYTEKQSHTSAHRAVYPQNTKKKVHKYEQVDK